MAKQIKVTIKWFNKDKGFGFFSRSGGKDIFVHITLLESFGFAPEDMVGGHSALIEYESNGDNKQTTAIYAIGSKSAKKPQLTARTNQKRLARSVSSAKKKWVAGEAPKVVVGMFSNLEPIQTTTPTDWLQLYTVINTDGDVVQYLIAEGEDVLKQLGDVSKECAIKCHSLLVRGVAGKRQAA